MGDFEVSADFVETEAKERSDVKVGAEAKSACSTDDSVPASVVGASGGLALEALVCDSFYGSRLGKC